MKERTEFSVLFVLNSSPLFLCSIILVPLPLILHRKYRKAHLSQFRGHLSTLDIQGPFLSLGLLGHSLLKTLPFFRFCDITPSAFPLFPPVMT